MATTVNEVDQPVMMSSRGRTIIPTDKGRLFQLGKLQKQRNDVQKKLYIELNNLKSMIDSDDQQNASDVMKQADNVQHLSREFMILH